MHHSGIYSAEFADDLAWLCGELGVERAVLVGHSMGGLIALQLAATHPELSAAVCLIDSVVSPPTRSLPNSSYSVISLLELPTFKLSNSQQALFIETDDPVRKAMC